MIYAIFGIIINSKEVKRRNLWYLFTKTNMQTIEQPEG
jgi:hypothetical protein